ncbi:MAG: glycosyltransferase [Holdemanella porci]
MNTEDIKIGVVVLNFNNFEDTVNCVNSVLNQKHISLRVVVVDNGSQNDSFSVLCDKFSKIDNVTLIKNNENLGYARGNNVGIRKLRDQGYEYIFIANSDVVFTSSMILHDLACGDEDEVGILIPIIKNLDGSIEKRVAYKRKLFSLRMIRYFIRSQIDLIKKRNYSKQSISAIDSYRYFTGLQRNYYVVTGSGFLLTKRFLDTYGQLYPMTFLYGEEWATMIYLHKAQLCSKVIQTDVILHKGAASTPKSNNKKKIQYKAYSARKVVKLVFLNKSQIRKLYGINGVIEENKNV